MARHNDLGKWGEQLARDYLVSHGYSVYEQNSHMGGREIDIIVTKGTRIVFVEVKTRSTDFTDPLDAVDRKKIRRMVRAADIMLSALNVRYEPQFDIITIVGTPESGHTLTHYKDAFMAPLSGAM